MEASMFPNQPFQFVRQVYRANDTITESRCPQCGVLIAAATEDKYLAIAEAVHKCRTINAPRLTREDLGRFH
jgi:phage FluMu protein Com